MSEVVTLNSPPLTRSGREYLEVKLEIEARGSNRVQRTYLPDQAFECPKPGTIRSSLEWCMTSRETSERAGKGTAASAKTGGTIGQRRAAHRLSGVTATVLDALLHSRRAEVSAEKSRWAEAGSWSASGRDRRQAALDQASTIEDHASPRNLHKAPPVDDCYSMLPSAVR